MIKNIIALLQTDDFIKGSYNVQVAKGLYSIPTTFREGIKQYRRERHLKKNKK